MIPEYSSSHSAVIPVIDNFRQRVSLVVKEMLQEDDIYVSDILDGIPKFTDENPAPFVKWLREQTLGWIKDPFPYLFVFQSKEGFYLVSGTDCQIIACNSSKIALQSNEMSTAIQE